MDELYNSITGFVATSVGLLLSMSPGELLITLWPFILLELPRYVLMEFIVLWRALKPEPPAKVRFRVHLEQELPLVSVLLPGYNECDTLETTVLSLREQTYPNLEIIVVSDGSSDGMNEVGRRLERKGWIRFFEHKVRGGKSSAENLALGAARGEYIVYCDADSTFDRDSIWFLLMEFYRPDVLAVAGSLRVRNADTNLLTRLQGLQYLFSIGVGRRVSAMLEILFIVSGAFGAIRHSALKMSGGWDTGPGEDGDITIKTRLAGGHIAFAPQAMCMTDVPDTWWAFFRQQMRWNHSTIRFRLRKYGWMFNPFSRPFELRNLLGCYDAVVYEVVLAFGLPFYLVWLYSTHGDIFWHLMLAILLVYTAFNYLHYFIALGLSERPRVDLKFFPYLPLYALFIGFYLRTVRLLAYTDEFLFKSSYRDSYVPAPVQRETRRNDPW